LNFALLQLEQEKVGMLFIWSVCCYYTLLSTSLSIGAIIRPARNLCHRCAISSDTWDIRSHSADFSDSFSPSASISYSQESLYYYASVPQEGAARRIS